MLYVTTTPHERNIDVVNKTSSGPAYTDHDAATQKNTDEGRRAIYAS
jgi:hypothetical protein